MKNGRLVPAAAFLGAAALALSAGSREEPSDLRVTLERLLRAASETNGAYETARGLTDTVGPRLSGSPGDARAIAWAQAALKAQGFSNVHAEPVIVPHWERGEESGEIVSPAPLRLSLCALGGSVGTPPGGVEARGLAPRREEDVLGQLLGRLRAAQQPQPEGEDRARVARVQHPHRVLVPGKEPLHELLLLADEERSVGPSVHPVSFR